MARVSIELPGTFGFTTETPIYLEHINRANHLDNAALLALLAEARARFFKSLGYDESNIEGVGFVIADIAVQYRAEAFHGDTLVFGIAARDFSSRGCDLVFRASSKLEGREVARGEVGLVFFDFVTRKPAPVPARFRARVGDAEEGRAS